MSGAEAEDEIYLDWAASTPIRPEALRAMIDATAVGYGNPTGAHRRARIARRIVDDARDQVADLTGAEPSEVIFCGSGTEADNLAIFGALSARAGNVACSAVEHHAVLRPVEHLGGTILAVDERGRVDLDQLEAIADDRLRVVSVMLANNETGVVQELAEIRSVLDERAPHALLHTDAVQAYPWLDVAKLAAPADLVSLSSHKFGGPKGVGVLIVRSSAHIGPLILGGGQEFELRSGTHNVAGIAGFGAAALAMAAERDEVVERVGALRDRLVSGIKAVLPDTVETAIDTPDGSVPGPEAERVVKVAGSAHLCFPGIESEALLFLLERRGVCASAASSCASGAQDPSHVLAAMGYPRSLAAGSLRLSLGFGTTAADIERALDVIPNCVLHLRARQTPEEHEAMQVMVAMSGGVDSSVATALMLQAGHDVVGVTMKLWGGPSDTGCCSVSDVLDARRAADALGVDHHVFNFGDDFERDVIAPYVADHAAGLTPNPCIECNRSIKFARLLERARSLGFDAVATGHHARIVSGADGSRRIGRGVDRAKDQSYVLHMLSPADLEQVELPIGELHKSAVRRIAAELGMRTATKPDSQDVCFIASTTSRREFLDDRLTLRPATVVDGAGIAVGRVDAVQTVTIGQRKGLGLRGGAPAQYVNDIDVAAGRVVVGSRDDLLTSFVDLDELVWAGPAIDTDLEAQTSAHGTPLPAAVVGDRVVWQSPQQRVAPGQTVVLYQRDVVVGGGIAVRRDDWR